MTWTRRRFLELSAGTAAAFAFRRRAGAAPPPATDTKTIDALRGLVTQRALVTDDPWVATALERYFPTPLRGPYKAQIHAHPLRREIIATHVANSMVNRVGSTFVHRMQEETGAAAQSCGDVGAGRGSGRRDSSRRRAIEAEQRQAGESAAVYPVGPGTVPVS